MLKIGFKLLFSLALVSLFSGCGTENSSADITPDLNETNGSTDPTLEEKIEKNSNFEIYNEDCFQGTNPALCGFEPTLSEDPSSGMPQIPCEDKVYCL
jgi:hypothetical protein